MEIFDNCGRLSFWVVANFCGCNLGEVSDLCAKFGGVVHYGAKVMKR